MGSSLVLVAQASGHRVTDLSGASWGLGEGRQRGWHRHLSLSRLAAPWWDVPGETAATLAPLAEQGVTSPGVFGDSPGVLCAPSLRRAFGTRLPQQPV